LFGKLLGKNETKTSREKKKKKALARTIRLHVLLKKERIGFLLGM
jgi:hypothetical protein